MCFVSKRQNLQKNLIFYQNKDQASLLVCGSKKTKPLKVFCYWNLAKRKQVKKKHFSCKGQQLSSAFIFHKLHANQYAAPADIIGFTDFIR